LRVGCLAAYIDYSGVTTPATQTLKEVGVSGTSVATFTQTPTMTHTFCAITDVQIYSIAIKDAWSDSWVFKCIKFMS